MEVAVVAGELEQGISEIVFVKVTVPPPGSIRIREMPRGICKLLTRHGGFLCRGMVSPMACVGMNGSAVARSSEFIGRDQTALDRGKDSYEIEQLLQACLEVKGNVLTIGNPEGKFFGDLRMAFRSFLAFSLWSFRFLTVPGSWEEFSPPIEISLRSSPEAVHKVIIRTKWRKGMKRAADKSRQHAVMLKPFHPACEGGRSQTHGKQKEEKDKGT